MARSSTPKFRIEYKTRGTNYITPGAWNVKSFGLVHGLGKPTEDNIGKHVEHLNHSFKYGANAHMWETFGPSCLIISARVVRQADDVVVGSWREYA